MLGSLFAAALAFTSAEAHLAYETARELAEHYSPRDAGTIRARHAAQYILERASAAGGDVFIDSFTDSTPRGVKRFYNVECRYKSSSDNPWIVFVSHYDTKCGVDMQGANDGASTSGLLVALCDLVHSSRPANVNVAFIWTDGEECMESYGPGDGFWGSKRAASRLKQEGVDVDAVVCLDMLGDKNLSISIPSNSSRVLKREILEISRSLGLSGTVSTIRVKVKDDHVAFLDAGFPAVDLIDFEYGSGPGLNDYWHTPEDSMDKISEQSLLASGRIAAAMVEQRENNPAKRKQR